MLNVFRNQLLKKISKKESKENDKGVNELK